MDIIEYFIYAIFFVILLMVFRNEFMNLYEDFNSHFYKNTNNLNTICDSCNQNL